jgi:acetylcholinesterase
LTTLSAPIIALFGLWLWWFRSSGRYLPSIPFAGHPKLSVTIRQGTFVGVEAKSDYPQTLELFLGIPYALSTAGERRFMPPVGVGASKKTFDASKHGNRCPAGGPDDTLQSEDCLNLNIYRPKERNSTEPLPVLIHIHGGSFNFGFGHGRQIWNLVGWAAEPFIGISFNYRLGAFGFLASNLTASEGLLNVGLKDQALLLEWVQENIAAFGGNPNDVTLMGSSAGAHSVSPWLHFYILPSLRSSDLLVYFQSIECSCIYHVVLKGNILY